MVETGKGHPAACPYFKIKHAPLACDEVQYYTLSYTLSNQTVVIWHIYDEASCKRQGRISNCFRTAGKESAQQQRFLSVAAGKSGNFYIHNKNINDPTRQDLFRS
jgi:hypothetical protein